MLKWFEKLVDPYPTKDLNKPLPTRFFPFVWQAAKGVRPYLLLLILFTAGAASFEAVLYAKIGDLVNWLSKSQPDTFLAQHQNNLILLSAILLANIFFQYAVDCEASSFIQLFSDAFALAFSQSTAATKLRFFPQ